MLAVSVSRGTSVHLWNACVFDGTIRGVGIAQSMNVGIVFSLQAEVKTSSNVVVDLPAAVLVILCVCCAGMHSSLQDGRHPFRRVQQDGDSILRQQFRREGLSCIYFFRAL